MSKDVNWDENENSIVFLSPMERAINNYDTGETIGKAIIKEFYNDKITENSIYRTDFCGRSLFLDDTFIEEVIFEPDKKTMLFSFSSQFTSFDIILATSLIAIYVVSS